MFPYYLNLPILNSLLIPLEVNKTVKNVAVTMDNSVDSSSFFNIWARNTIKRKE